MAWLMSSKEHTKTCKLCKETLFLDKFPCRPSNRPGGKPIPVSAYCKRCRHLKQKYTALGQDYKQILAQLVDYCEICERTDRKLVIDHDHETGEFRGTLCYGCNSGLGNLGDGKLVDAALEYVHRPKKVLPSS